MSSKNTEQIKERLDIVDVISGYLKVEKAGINYKAKCPFHNEKTPSFFISPTRQSFYCFGCGEKGDIFSFVEKFENIDFKEALKTLADKAGIKLESFKEEDGNKDEKEEVFTVMEMAAKFYEENLAQNNDGLEYLEKRGLTKDSVSKWRLGFAKDEWRNLHDFLESKKITREKMLEAGLIKKAQNTEENKNVDKFYDTFRNRIMFPIFDQNGRVIAFSGRAMKEDEKTPKYLNSPETKLFYKSEVLYGFNVAKNNIRKLDYAVLVEGQMDLLMSHQAGVFNTVASSGTALTELHLKKLGRLSNRIILAYDCDNAGQKAARRAAEMALAMGMEVKIASLPEGEDPDSVIKKDPEKWKDALKESEHFTDFALNQAVKNYKDKNLIREILKNVLPLAHLIKSDIEKSQFVKKVANKMRVSEDAVWNDLNKMERRKDGKMERLEEQKKNNRDKMEELLWEMDVKEIEKEKEKQIKKKEFEKKRTEISIMLDDKDISEKEKEKLKEIYKENEQKIKDFNN
jgi:DNA primase